MGRDLSPPETEATGYSDTYCIRSFYRIAVKQANRNNLLLRRLYIGCMAISKYACQCS